MHELSQSEKVSKNLLLKYEVGNVFQNQGKPFKAMGESKQHGAFEELHVICCGWNTVWVQGG